MYNQILFSRKFSNALIKTVKFQDGPNLNELWKELKLLHEKFDEIVSSIKNLTIRLER
jgi:hypothetical protein